MHRGDREVHALMSNGQGRVGRRELLVGAAAGLTLVGCGGPGAGSDGALAPDPSTLTCGSPASGPGLGYCLLRKQKLTLPGVAKLAVGRMAIMGFDDHNAAIVARDERGFYALSATCPHQCTTVTMCESACARPIVSPNGCRPPLTASLPKSGPAFLCPSHASIFGPDGAVLAGPASKALPSIALNLVGDDAVVDLSTPAQPGERVLPG